MKNLLRQDGEQKGGEQKVERAKGSNHEKEKMQV